MNKIIAIMLMYFGVHSLAYAGKDDCEEKYHRGYPVTLKQCSYSDGGSGYYVITNTGSSRARICWAINSSDGHCDTLDAGDTSKGSCFYCGNKNHNGDFILSLKSYDLK